MESVRNGHRRILISKYSVSKKLATDSSKI
jgi:hypothetical protein